MHVRVNGLNIDLYHGDEHISGICVREGESEIEGALHLIQDCGRLVDGDKIVVAATFWEE